MSKYTNTQTTKSNCAKENTIDTNLNSVYCHPDSQSSQMPFRLSEHDNCGQSNMSNGDKIDPFIMDKLPVCFRDNVPSQYPGTYRHSTLIGNYPSLTIDSLRGKCAK